MTYEDTEFAKIKDEIHFRKDCDTFSASSFTAEIRKEFAVPYVDTPIGNYYEQIIMGYRILGYEPIEDFEEL